MVRPHEAVKGFLSHLIYHVASIPVMYYHTTLPNDSLLMGRILFLKAAKGIDSDLVLRYDIDAKAFSHPFLVLGHLEDPNDLAVCTVSVSCVV